jgi:hypothetical protein
VQTFDLICLANSYKNNRRCVAGLRADGGGWVRPVSDREKGELDSHQYCYPDRSEPKVLDVIRMGLSEPRPLPYQPENWLIDGSGWEPVRRPASVDYAAVVAGAVSRTPSLLGSIGNRVPQAEYRQFADRKSLEIVQPSDIVWHATPDKETGRNRARVQFRLQDARYDLPLTDPEFVRSLRTLAPGSHSSSELWIPRDRKLLFTVGMSQPFGGVCYKLVVAVVVLPQVWEPFFGSAGGEELPLTPQPCGAGQCSRPRWGLASLLAPITEWWSRGVR